MSKEVNLIATLTPAEGKLEQVPRAIYFRHPRRQYLKKALLTQLAYSLLNWSRTLPPASKATNQAAYNTMLWCTRKAVTLCAWKGK